MNDEREYLLESMHITIHTMAFIGSHVSLLWFRARRTMLLVD